MTHSRGKESLPSTPRSGSPAVFSWIAAVWIICFLCYFFSESIEDPDLPRTELWSMLADEMLGLHDAAPAKDLAESNSGLRFLSQRIPLFSWAAAILLMAAIHGDAIYSLVLRRCRLLQTEQLAIRLGTGLGLLSIVTLCSGLAGQLTRTAMIVPAVISLMTSCLIRWKYRHDPPEQHVTLPADQRSSRFIGPLALIVIVPFTIYLLLGAISPPTDFDVRE